ncbi:MAG: DUF1232 domain-containing protein [Limnochordia bacterium]
MRCRDCGREIALAQICPYCGHRSKPGSSDAKDTAKKKTSRARGVFRGPVAPHKTQIRRSVFGIFPATIRYFADPDVPHWRKAAILIGILYVISPIDLVPGAALPLLGWIDDAFVAAFTWRLLQSELAHYDNDP